MVVAPRHFYSWLCCESRIGSHTKTLTLQDGFTKSQAGTDEHCARMLSIAVNFVKGFYFFLLFLPCLLLSCCTVHSSGAKRPVIDLHLSRSSVCSGGVIMFDWDRA
jgi:hypothetical protein